jgi:hypothetical protein
MINRFSHKAKLLAGVVAAMLSVAVPVSLAVAPSAAAATSYKFNYYVAKGPIPKNLLHETGKLVGSPFGKGTFTASTEVPITKYVWSFKGGALDVKFTSTLKGVIASGPWKVTGGTGRFAHAKGSGSGSGAIDGSKQFHFVGTVTL